jgi:hypothetical protein
MQTIFEIAGGQVLGRNHRKTGKNNQDALYTICRPHFMIGVVCDGCGSSDHSEVGAKIGARVVGDEITMAAEKSLETVDWAVSSPAFWEDVRCNSLVRIHTIASSMGETIASTLHDYFLFTVVGFVITAEMTAIFGIGDGMILINGCAQSLGIFAGNQPPYLAYGLMGPSFEATYGDLLSLGIHQKLPTEALDSLVVGTDGLTQMSQAAKSLSIVERIGALIADDRCFKNPDALRRRLWRLNRDSVRYIRNGYGNITNIQKTVGCFPDDTTLIMVRRRKN